MPSGIAVVHGTAAVVDRFNARHRPLIGFLVAGSLNCAGEFEPASSASGTSDSMAPNEGLSPASFADATDVLDDAGVNAEVQDASSPLEAGRYSFADSNFGGVVGAVDARASDAGPSDTGTTGSLDHFSVEFMSRGLNIDGEDEIRLTCDDAVSGVEGHQPCDVGAGSFTYEVWLFGDAVSNANVSGLPVDVDRNTYDWIDGNIFLDRDVFGGSCDGRDFGASIIDERVSFGIGGLPGGGPLTIYGSTRVVNTPPMWHHVALVYDDAAPGNQLRIHVDGILDHRSSTAISDGNRSIPDVGCTAGSASSALRQVDLAIGTEKHGFSGISFEGRVGRIRIWDVARTEAQIADNWDREIACSANGLVARIELEEGSGRVAADGCGISPDGTVDLGSRGQTQWVMDGPPIHR